MSASTFEIRGWHVGVGVTAFFALVISVDIAFTVLAYRTYPGAVSVTPYEDGLAYNRKLSQQRAQAALGWTVAAESRPGLVIVTARDASGDALRGLAVDAKLERPATEAGRRSIMLKETAPGVYAASTELTGSWDLTASLQDTAGHRFEAERRLSWR